MARKTSHMCVLETTGMLSVRGSPKPGKDVMSRLTPCTWSSKGAEATGATGVVAITAMVWSETIVWFVWCNGGVVVSVSW